jgi:hypothetical protein
MASESPTEWPPEIDWKLLCLNGGHAVRGIYFPCEHGLRLKVLSLYGVHAGAWVWEGSPSDWHDFDRETCHE